jgi:large subunit ribosomal protein L23
MSKTIALKPRMSEKTYALSLTRNTFVFDVPTSTNKIQIADAVADQFDVKVKDVRIVVSKGKKARSIRLGGKARKMVMGKRPDTKKAYVTLKDGDTIPVFAALDEQVAKEEKAATAAERKASKKDKEAK